MNTDIEQPGLFQDPLGLRLRAAREKAQLTRDAAAQRLKLPVAIVEAMEREDWARLGAPIYVRSHLTGYLKLLGLPLVLANVPAAQQPGPVLAAMETRSRIQASVDRSMRNLVYLVMTGVIVAPIVWLAMHYDGRAVPAPALTLEAEPVAAPVATDAAVAGTDISLELPSSAEPRASAVASVPAQADAGPDAAAAAPSPAPEPSPLLASMASFGPGGTEPVAADDVRLSFRAESWLEVLAADGRRLERGLVAAGSERRYAAGEQVRITLGNADAVRVERAGVAVDLAPYRTANVARFTVSSASELAPAGN